MKCSDLFGFAQITEAVIAPGGDVVAYVKRTANASADRYDFELLLAAIPGMGWPGIKGPVGQGLRQPTWAPCGRKLAVVEYGAGEPDASVVVISGLDGSRRRLATGLSEPACIRWSPDGRQIGFLAVSTVPQIALRPGTGASRSAAAPLLTRDFSAKIDGLGIASAWQRHLFTVNCETGAILQVTAGHLWVDDFCYSPSGQIVFCGSEPYSGSVPRQPGAIRPCGLWIMDCDGGPAKPLTTTEVSARCPVFAADDHVVFVGLPGLRADLPGLFTVPVGGGPVHRLAGPLDRGLVVGSASSQEGHPPVPSARDEVLFCARDGGCVQLYETSLHDPARVRRIAGSGSESVSAVSTGRSGVPLAYVSSRADGTQRLTVLDRRSGSRTVLAETGPSAEMLPAVAEQFTARDGLKLEGWLIRGRSRGPAPLLLDVHGGSFSGAWSPLVQPSRLYQQELAEQGWTILLLNARGSDGYGSGFARAAIGAWGSADSPDYHDAVDALISSGLVDPTRLAVTGYSYGGFMSNWLTATTDRFCAAVAGGSICDFVSLFGTSDMGWVMSEYDIGLRSPLDPLEALKRSPIGQLSRPVRTPTLLLHGEADLRCPISQAEEWLALLLSVGCEATLVRYPGASHGFLSDGPPSYALDYGIRVVQWVTGHVPGGPPQSAPGTL